MKSSTLKSDLVKQRARTENLKTKVAHLEEEIRALQARYDVLFSIAVDFAHRKSLKTESKAYLEIQLIREVDKCRQTHPSV